MQSANADDNIGEKVRRARLRRRVTQQSLARRMRMTQSNLSKIECGRTAVSYETVVAFCRALRMKSLDDNEDVAPLDMRGRPRIAPYGRIATRRRT